MKQVNDSLLIHFQTEVVTLATCWRVERTDGVVFGFTNHNQNIKIDNITYKAKTGFNNTALATSNTMSVDNLELSSVFSDDSIREEDLVGGKFDLAKIDIFWVNYENLPCHLSEYPPRHLLLISGILGQVQNSDFTFEAEVRSLSQFLSQKIIEVTSKYCRATFGDAKCGVNLSPYTHTGTIIGFSNNRVFYSDLSNPNDYFTGGELTFTSGTNSGLKAMIASYSNGQFILFESMPYQIAVNDTFSAIAGCQKTIEACRSFNNVANFRAEPHVPGADKYITGGRQ